MELRPTPIHWKLILIQFLFINIQFIFSLDAYANEGNSDPLFMEIKTFTDKISNGENFEVQLQLQLPKGFHAYEDQFRVEITSPEGFKVGPLQLSPRKEWFDKFSKKKRSGMENIAQLKFLLEAPESFTSTSNEVVLALTYQACGDSFCLFPKTKELRIKSQFIENNKNKMIKLPNQNTSNESTETEPLSIFNLKTFESILNQTWWLALIVAFFAGVLTSFTPCIFPMIPITLAVLGHHSEKRSRLGNFLTSLVYVHGIATTYSLLGLVAATTGHLFGSILSHTSVLIFVCSLFLIMSISMFGLFEIQMPNFMHQYFGSGSKKKGLWGVYFSGLFAGIVASPCVGPVLVSILTYVSTQKNPLFGFALLFTYAMGLGLIFILLGVFTEFTRRLPRSGPWMNVMKFILGSLMLFAFYYYLDLLLPLRFFYVSLGIGLITVASLSGAFSKPTEASKIRYLIKGFMQALLFLGISYLLVGVLDLQIGAEKHTNVSEDLKISRPQWISFSTEELKRAAVEKRPVIVDFYADWCAACHDLDKNVFNHSDFSNHTENFVLLKFDATKESPELKMLRDQYDIKGLPTILFFDRQGQLHKNLTLTEFENFEQFKMRIKLLNQSATK